MHLFSRRSTLQRAVGKMTSKAGRRSAAKSGAAALTGVVTAVAASAVVSSAHRKANSFKVRDGDMGLAAQSQQGRLTPL
jgi:hypothetical protein